MLRVSAFARFILIHKTLYGVDAKSIVQLNKLKTREVYVAKVAQSGMKELRSIPNPNPTAQHF